MLSCCYSNDITMSDVKVLPNAVSVQTDPDNQKAPEFDWWSKYYYSIKDERRTQQNYVDQGHDALVVSALEITFSVMAV